MRSPKLPTANPRPCSRTGVDLPGVGESEIEANLMEPGFYPQRNVLQSSHEVLCETWRGWLPSPVLKLSGPSQDKALFLISVGARLGALLPFAKQVVCSEADR